MKQILGGGCMIQILAHSDNSAALHCNARSFQRYVTWARSGKHGADKRQITSAAGYCVLQEINTRWRLGKQIWHTGSCAHMHPCSQSQWCGEGALMSCRRIYIALISSWLLACPSVANMEKCAAETWQLMQRWGSTGKKYNSVVHRKKKWEQNSPQGSSYEEE